FASFECTIRLMTIRTFKSGDSREQSNLLPPRIEDYVGLDNPVRAIDVFVGALDFAKLGFKHADRGVGVGQPPYDPSDLLKLYLYGYVNQIRSSRRLEREAGRNLELIWLLKNLTPGYRTIATFRKENWAALKAAKRRSGGWQQGRWRRCRREGEGAEGPARTGASRPQHPGDK